MFLRSSDRKIARAIDAAPILTPVDGMGELRGADSFGEFAGSQAEQSTIAVATEEGLRYLISRSSKIMKRDLPDKDIDEIVRHERGHADAAKVVGALATQYGVRYYRVPDPESPGDHLIDFEPFTEHRFGRRTNSLELASVLAYPLEPSHGDIADIQGLGFSGVKEVGQLTAEFNRRYGFTLPVPMSFSPYGAMLIESASGEATVLYARGTAASL